MMYVRSTFSVGLLVVLVTTLCACSSYVHVANNAFADIRSLPYGFPWDSSFYIEMPTTKNVLFDKEVVQKIAIMLENKGYEVVRSRERADYILAFSVAMKSHTEKVLVPHYIPGPVKTKRSKVLTSDGRWTDVVEETTSSGHYEDVEEERTVFKKELTIQVFDMVQEAATGNEEMVWNTTVSSNNSRDDLRAEIDYLLVAAFKHFGRNTQKKIYADVNSRDAKMLRRQYCEI